MDVLLENLIRSPRLQLYRERIEELLRHEHEARQRYYESLTEDSHAEFINGEVIVHSQAQHRHNSAARRLLKLIDIYIATRKLGTVGIEKYLISLTRNDYEPDLCYWTREVAERFTADHIEFPAPQLVVEVLSPNTQANDRGVKFEDYAAHGVQEYWIVDPDSESVEQYMLRGDAFELHIKSATGMIRSVAIKGFEIPIRAIFDDEENLTVLRRMLGPA